MSSSSGPHSSHRPDAERESEIEQVGSPEEVFHHPASEFVIDFLGNVNVFSGRIENGRAMVAGLALDLPEFADREAPSANVYVRPHELEIERHRNGAPALAASVTRINPAGSVAKIILRGGHGGDLQVDLPLERYEQLQLQLGDQVFVSPKKLRVFTPDYVI